MSRINVEVVPNKVFIGCPWKIMRPKYEKIVKDLEHRFPLNFILIGREHDQRAEELLELIKKNLLSSTMAIFDVTGGNPNVSLEYGIADASEVTPILYLNVHGRNKLPNQDSSIIADLAGQKRKQWKNEKGLNQLLTEFAKTHSFTKRFEVAFSKISKKMNRHEKKSYRTLALKIIHHIDEKETVRRADVLESLKGENYDEKAVNFMLSRLHDEKLIVISTGRYAEVRIS